MKESNKHLVVTILVGQLVSFLCFGIYALVTLDMSVLPQLQFAWLFDRILDLWSHFFLAVSLCGIILGVSFFGARKGGASQGGGGKIQGGALGILLFFTVVHILLMAFVAGPAKAGQEQVVRISIEYRQDLEKIKQLRKSGQLEAALELARAAVGLVPGYDEPEKLRDDLLREMDRKRMVSTDSGAQIGATAGPMASAAQQSGWTYAELMIKARQYLEMKDFFTALFFLNLAEKNRQDNEVTGLLTETRKGVMGVETGDTQDLKTRRFVIKRTAILDLIPLAAYPEAYYQLLAAEELALQEGLTPERAFSSYRYDGESALPNDGRYADPDVRLWMPFVHEKLSQICFFSDEMAAADRQANHGSLVFRNSDDSGRRMYVYFKSIYPLGSLNYLVEAPEILVLDATGTVIVQWGSAWGKVVNKRLLLKSMDKSQESLVSGAELIAGGADRNLLDIVDLEFTAEELYGFAANLSGVGSVSLAGQLSMFEGMKQAGLDVSRLELALLDQFTRAISAISLAILAWIFGRVMRSRYLGRPVFLLILSVPLLLFAAVLVIDGYNYFVGLVNQMLHGSAGFWGGLWWQLGLQIIQLLVVLFVFASLSSREE